VTTTGKVYLVGAGPGDRGLITVKGLECIRIAEAIIYDALVDEQILGEARADAELIYVGKTYEGHTLEQNEINSLLVNKAKEGKTVARLKGGDPFVFGRGGEEVQALAAEGIPFEVVPGISAGTAVPAYAGIPVTHRGLASSLALVTGHEDPTKEMSSVAWDKLATGVDTLVLFMGFGNLAQIVGELVKNGRPPATPVALVREGTRPSQRVITGTLENIVAQAEGSDFKPPVIVVVGEVVGLRETARWFDTRPLFGKRVLVTRSRHQASVLSKLLAEHGAEPIEMPVIAMEEISDNEELGEAIRGLSNYEWVVLTSANGVEAFFNRVMALGMDAREFKGVKLCAVGPATAAALEEHGLRADYVPPVYTVEGIINGFGSMDIQDARVLIPRAEMVDERLVERLTDMGAKVEQISAYRVVPVTDDASIAKGRQMLSEGKIDIVTFCSSSTVRNLVSVLGGGEVLKPTTVACIGPVTAATAAELGLRVDIVAEESTAPGLVEAMLRAYAGQQ
jgi:uroporphyrinogen III methyltransferase/synthase